MISLYKPTVSDLWFREKMMNDPETMSYNDLWGGTIPFPKEKWNKWHQTWIQNDSRERYYRYLISEENGLFVGEAAYHLDPVRGIYLSDIVVFSEYRRKGYGSEGLLLLCEAAKENGITILYDELAAGNSSLSLFLKNGFSVDCRTSKTVLVKKEL